MSNYPVEAKVRAATATSLAAALALAVCNATIGDVSILGPLPGWLQFMIIAALPTLAVYLAAWSAPHTPRPS